MTNIPAQLTSFVGREKETADLLRLVDSSRLVTLTGAGGCGKTRLALWLANKLKNKFADGVLWVELASVTDALLVPQVLAKALDISTQAGNALTDALVDNLRNKSMLIVLDNCEHLLIACATLSARLLEASGISLLTTSREALSVRGEVLYSVLPLSLPPIDSSDMDVQRYDAIRLFVERARTIVPSFTLTSENLGTIVSVCRHLDGIPLAIELASARINVLTVDQIDSRLNDRFRLLKESSHLTTRHHRNLRATLDWSYDLLTHSERVVLHRLSVFAGGCSLTTAEVVCSGNGVEPGQVLDLLASLISKSILMAQTLQRGEARYYLLETIRQYAHEKLLLSGELQMIRDQHLDCFIQLTKDVLPKLSGTYQRIWLNWLESEFDNIRAALTWSLESGRIEAGLRIANNIYQFWTIRDYAEEGLVWVERLLAGASGRVDPEIQANALAFTVFLAGFRGNTKAQIKYGEEAAVLAVSLDEKDKPALRWALTAQAYGVQAVGNYQAQFNLSQRVIELNRELGDRNQLAVSLSTTSFLAMSLTNYADAHAMLEEALPILREIGNPYRIAMALNFSGDLARCEQNYPTADRAYEESISLLRMLDAPRDLASALQNQGFTCLQLGKVERAFAFFSEGITIQTGQQNTPGISECLIGFAGTALKFGLPNAGARLLAAAEKLGGQQLASKWAATKMEYERYLALIRALLTENAFQEEQAEGRKFTLEQAVEYAQHLPFQSEAGGVIAKKKGDLTGREREITKLIARGKSNGEIANELVISKRTVEKHIAHIITNLGVTNRAQIVRWAIEAGLVGLNDSTSLAHTQ